MRTCVGCQRPDAPEHLVRVVLGPDGSLLPDLGGRAPGRGAWLHPRSDCLARAVPRGFARSFRASVRTGVEELAGAIRELAFRRVEGLLNAAWRARRLEVGTTAVKEALAADRAVCVLLATDARAAAETPLVQQAVASGKALAWGTKDSLGRATGREEVAVVAVTDAGFAQALSTAVRLSQYPLPGLERPSSSRTAQGGGATEV